ncbi:MAG: response regulator [Deltaproteobacteria bacterium]|nr:response regulator [Deltaproteobacteria bacterium]MBW2218717.1 response regulator [Deltaproteobacteria bacterium]
MIDRRLLIVDDDEMITDMFRKGFTKAGYTVRRAASAEEALAILEKEKYSVMFLDLKLPAMDGVELCRKIRKNDFVSLIFAVTGYASFYEFEECRKAGFDDFFTKPVDLKVLYRAAMDAFDKIERWNK